jgi:hypothetical protein
MEKNIDEKTNDILEMSTERLIYTLPSFIDQIRKNGIKKSMEESPGLLYRLLTKLEESDLPKIGADAPEILDSFMDVFWEGIAVKAESLRPYLERFGDFTVNYETFDTPLKAHARVSDGKITGGSGMVKFREQDARWFGDTKEVLALLRGEFSMVKLFTEKLFFEGFLGLVQKKASPFNALVGSLAM